MALAYSSNRGYGNIHPTLGELRIGSVPVCIPHPYYPGETLTLGEVLVTEAEILARMEERKEERRAKFTLGYGFCFGHNELKAIAMGTLDRAMVAENPQAPAEDEEFVLSHIDGIEASGFVAHWKLPHYVDFQAELNQVRSIQEREGGKMNLYNYAFLDENSKREIRRALLKSVAIPGYQVPFGSRELPIARGWGTGGLQITL